ncbi:MAG TPA: arginase family protein, partial [Salinimicrobium sp.]|nr:arginase family protein [Salinimicrobium sp.]
INKPLNALNIDAHSDLRKMGYRHSGNGFSFAIKEKLLKKYAIFGLHENYTPQYIFDQVDGDEDIRYVLFDGLSRGQMKQAFDELLEFTSNEAFGLEADCDSIAGFPSSAVSPTGFSLEEVRDFVRKAAGNKNCVYFHLCEAADSDLYPTGKALAYLVSDFIKNRFDE